ncbi:serine hydrolase domain-containing protein [Microbispora catharanthi]|uniref:Serine hydrolase n=1 Tax=Microbispora catharanthi TaxID=1712871 RepID=A0A5N6BJJ2_9ACTN|nr:serine hydrolase domain-containing protein [Microbispora catharanthi]KAB8180410.1 serine hydrolase [Microbispora catharanthi]
MLTRRDSLRLLAGAAAGVAALPALSARPAAAADRVWTVTGQSSSSLKPFDDTLESYMKARNIPYGSLAVLRQGKLVLARGYNWTTDTFQAQPTSLFRLASLSKPVTATAIMKLVQDGRLSLSATVAPMLGLSTALDPRLGNVTVLNLLQHLGGWGVYSQDAPDYLPDPMFSDFDIRDALRVPLPVTQANIMQYVSTTRRLDFDPGSTFWYSNYGYMLLGKVIEKVTGLSYATYVQQSVLSPMKITRMVQGRTAQSLRRSSEVPYYSQYGGTTVLDGSGAWVPAPYGAFNLENMAAHGAWLSTAVDMAKFTTIFDAPGLLTQPSLDAMFAPPSNYNLTDPSWYGMGWSVRPVNGSRSTWHSGSIAGTTTLMVRRWDGLSWVVLFDQRDDPSGLGYDNEIDNLMHQAADSVRSDSWPSTNLFPSYGL